MMGRSSTFGRKDRNASVVFSSVSELEGLAPSSGLLTAWYVLCGTIFALIRIPNEVPE